MISCGKHPTSIGSLAGRPVRRDHRSDGCAVNHAEHESPKDAHMPRKTSLELRARAIHHEIFLGSLGADARQPVSSS